MLAALLLLRFAATPSHPNRFDTIELRGTPRFRDDMVRGLTLLKRKAPRAYEIVTNNVGLIVQSKHTGMAAYLTPPTSYLYDYSAYETATFCASRIAHEALHSKLYHDYLRQHPGAREVPYDVWGTEAAERLCWDYGFQVLRELGAPPAEIARGAHFPTNRPWEIPFDKRDF